LNQRFEDHLDDDGDRDGLRNVGSIWTPDAADSLRILHQIHGRESSKTYIRNVCLQQ